MNQWASHYGPSDYVEPWSRAAEQQRGCFRRYLTQGLEQFRSNLSLRALTYSLLSWVGFLLETTTTSWSLVSWNSMMYKKGEIIECLSDWWLWVSDSDSEMFVPTCFYFTWFVFNPSFVHTDQRLVHYHSHSPSHSDIHLPPLWYQLHIGILLFTIFHNLLHCFHKNNEGTICTPWDVKYNWL